MKRDYRELYEKIVNSDWFKKAYHDKSLGECPFEIPELAESEDERIRKEIIDFIYSKIDRGSVTKEQREKSNSWIAYLEKQKVNTEGDFARGYDCGYAACLNSHGAEFFEKKKEQIAFSAANDWCRCFKCDNLINDVGVWDKCEKPNCTCSQWRDAYKGAMIALEKLNGN